MRVQGTHLLNRDGVRAWKDGHSCVWRRHGVWDFAEPGDNGAGAKAGVAGPKAVLLEKDYFRWRSVAGVRVHMRVFARMYVACIREYTACVRERRGAGGWMCLGVRVCVCVCVQAG